MGHCTSTVFSSLLFTEGTNCIYLNFNFYPSKIFGIRESAYNMQDWDPKDSLHRKNSTHHHTVFYSYLLKLVVVVVEVEVEVQF